MSTVNLSTTPAPSSQESTPSPREGRWTLMNPLANLVDLLIAKLGGADTSIDAPKIATHLVTPGPFLSLQSPPPSSKPISIPSSQKQEAIKMSHDFVSHMKGFDPEKNNPSREKFFEKAFELVDELRLLESDLNIKLIDTTLINELNSEYGKQIEKEAVIQRTKDLKKEIADFCKLTKASEEDRKQLLDEAMALHTKIATYGAVSELEIPILMLEEFREITDLTKADQLGLEIRNYCNTDFSRSRNQAFEARLLWDATVLHQQLINKYNNRILERSILILKQTTNQD